MILVMKTINIGSILCLLLTHALDVLSYPWQHMQKTKFMKNLLAKKNILQIQIKNFILIWEEVKDTWTNLKKPTRDDSDLTLSVKWKAAAIIKMRFRVTGYW